MTHQNLEQKLQRLQAAFHTTMRHLGCELAEQLEEGLTPDQFIVLEVLSKRGRCTASELAQEFHVKPSAITSMTNRLYKNNFIEREGDEKDRRVVYIKISRKGREVLSLSEAKRNEIMKKYMSRLTPHELCSLVEISEKIATIVQQTKEEL